MWCRLYFVRFDAAVVSVLLLQLCCGQLSAVLFFLAVAPVSVPLRGGRQSGSHSRTLGRKAGKIEN